MKQFLAYKLAIKTTPEQEKFFTRTSAQCRFVYNQYLKYRIDQYNKYLQAKESGSETYKEDFPIPSSMNSSKWLTQLKRDVPWLKEALSLSLVHELTRCDRSYKNFFKKLSKYPKFKNDKTPYSFYINNQSIKKIGPGLFRLPKIGLIKTFEKNYLPLKADIRYATISKSGTRWFISITVEEEMSDVQSNGGALAGVDLGVRQTTISDGTILLSPKPSASHSKKLRRIQKKLSRQKRGSANYTKTISKLKTLHYKIANKRLDWAHKTTHAMTHKYSVLGMETLKVKNLMSHKSHLGSSLSDVSLGELNRQLDYKSVWYGCKVLRASQFFPSSKLCSGCGTKNDVGRKTYWTCFDCNMLHDRDINAAKNLKNWALEELKTLSTVGQTGTLVGDYCTPMGQACGVGSSGFDASRNETIDHEAGIS